MRKIIVHAPAISSHASQWHYKPDSLHACWKQQPHELLHSMTAHTQHPTGSSTLPSPGGEGDEESVGWKTGLRAGVSSAYHCDGMDDGFDDLPELAVTFDDTMVLVSTTGRLTNEAAKTNAGSTRCPVLSYSAMENLRRVRPDLPFASLRQREQHDLSKDLQGPAVHFCEEVMRISSLGMKTRENTKVGPCTSTESHLAMDRSLDHGFHDLPELVLCFHEKVMCISSSGMVTYEAIANNEAKHVPVLSHDAMKDLRQARPDLPFASLTLRE